MARGRPAGSKNKKSGGGKKRGKSESMTGARENEVEVRAVSTELNLPPIEAKPGDFDRTFKEICDSEDTWKKLQGRHRQKLKDLKETNPRLYDAVKLGQKWKDEEPDRIREHLNVFGFVLPKLGYTIQLSMHDTLLGDENDLASKRGHQNGKAGTAMNNPYPENSDLANLYSDAYLRGQAGMPLLQGAQAQDDQDTQDDIAPADHNTRNGMDVEENASA